MAAAWIDGYTATCAAGTGLAALRDAITTRRTGLRPMTLAPAAATTWLGRVDGVEALAWPAALAAWESRNNRLARLGLAQDGFEARVRVQVAATGATRVGIIAGTSTSSIGRTEEAYRKLDPEGGFRPEFVQPAVHNPHSTGEFLAELLGIGGPVMTISTACSSSAKVFAAAARWLDAGVVDAVVVAGVDSLCLSTLHGFESLQLVSRDLCRPFDARRDGLNIGEAAAFALLTRERPAAPQARLLGYGESCDAHHMSTPHPEGKGARAALEQALAEAGLAAPDLGYVNLHGTGTRNNDAVESLALAAVVPDDVPAGSTKGWTGHTLGAAGLLEAVLTLEALATGRLPGTLNLEHAGADIARPILAGNLDRRIACAASNSFGFGGNNCVLLFGRAD